MKNMKYFIVACFSLCHFLIINAQETTKRDSITGFNAIDYLMQGRYRFPDQRFMKSHWLDNLYVQIGGGLFMPNRSGETKMELMQDMHLAVGKNLSAKHGFRLGYNLGRGRLKATNLEMKRSLLHLDYLFNVSAFINGYNPDRFFEASTILGAGYLETKAGDEKHRSPEGHFGVELRFRVSPQSFLTLEPMIQITDGYLQDNWRQLGLSSGATINYIQYLRPLSTEKTNSSRFTKMSPFFVELATGMQFQNLDLGLFPSKGGSYAVYVGKWLSDGLGVRGGFNGSFNRIKSEVVDGVPQHNDTRYLDGRFDLLVNPLGFWNKDNLNSWGGFHLLGGIIYGHSQPYDGREGYSYTGYNTGIQGWLRLQDNLQLFLEPRVSFITSDQENPQTNVKEEVKETLYNLNLGLRLNYSTWDERKSRYLRNTLFQPSFFLQAAGGISYTALHQYTYGGNGGLDYFGRVSAGYRFSPYHGLRVNFDYTKLQDKNEYGQKRAKDLNIVSLDYLFGLSNMMQEGYDQERKLGVEVYAGPMWSMSNQSFGGHLGALVKRRLNPHTSLFVSPEIAFLSKEEGSSMLFHNINPIFNVYAGVEYAFQGAKDFLHGILPQDRNKKAGTDFPFFVETGVGSSAILNASSEWSETIGTSFKYAIGHWINPAVAVRLSAESAWNPIGHQLHRHHILGGTDIVFNPWGISADYDHNTSWGLNVIAGGNLGIQKTAHKKQTTVYGFGGGLQLWTKVMPHSHLFFEPHYAHLITSNTENGDKNTGLLSAQVGMRIDYITPKRRVKPTSANQHFDDKGLFFQLEGGLLTESMHLHTAENGNRLNTVWSLGAGYQFDPLSAVRLAFDSHKFNNGEEREDRISASLAYMMNLNTLLSGYNPEARFSTELYAGPSAYYNLAQDKWSWGGLVGMQFGFKLNNQLSFHFSPELQTAFNSRYSDKRIAYKMGLKYRLNDQGRKLNSLDWFVNASTGVQLLANAPIDASNTLGLLHKLSIGTWMNSLVGVRFGATASINRWAEKNSTTSKYMQYYSFQPTMLFDPLSLIPAYDRSDASAGVYLFGGPEMGVTVMEKNNEWNSQYTTGFNIGMQGWLKIGEHQRLFVEPSYSRTTISDNDTPNSTRNNGMFGVNVGISMDIVKHGRTFNQGTEDMKRFFVQMGVGNGYDILNQNHDMKTSLHPSYEFVAGYRLDELSAVRLSIGHNAKKKNVALKDNDLSAAYQLNLSKLFTGDNSNKRFDLEAFAGVTCMNIEDLSLAVGGIVGVQANYHVNDRLYLYLSPEARIVHSKYKAILGIGYKW